MVVGFLAMHHSAKITLAFRTLAIWERDWRATFILGIGAATYNISVLVCNILLEKWFRYVPHPLLETLLDCYSEVTGPTAVVTILGFASLMFYDSVMFILISTRTVHEGRKTRSRILTILFRDGVIYYAILFGIVISLLLILILTSDIPYAALSVTNLLIATSLPQFEVTLVGSLAPELLNCGAIYRPGQLSSIRYLERRTILDEFTFPPQTVSDDNEVVIERGQ
ncbi:hypothetical protein BD410DRAFT_903195 [Rickenella mellea]|uniref:Uncharacterized protein n=1 Tax=Rickenella mellea TaxID=50990 RepID=A0A4Y7PFP5_9AGAM|nr:hypothetical protein BD410DRAFT_903195 [Rickenella mellea]